MLAVDRALMARPRLLMLDETSLGRALSDVAGAVARAPEVIDACPGLSGKDWSNAWVIQAPALDC